MKLFKYLLGFVLIFAAIFVISCSTMKIDTINYSDIEKYGFSEIIIPAGIIIESIDHRKIKSRNSAIDKIIKVTAKEQQISIRIALYDRNIDQSPIYNLLYNFENGQKYLIKYVINEANKRAIVIQEE